MKPSCLPSVVVTFTPKNNEPGQSLRMIHRPYASLPMEELEKHAEENDRGSLLELGERYYFGVLGAEQNYQTAYDYLLRAAEMDVQDAEYLVAECYRCGNAVQQDYDKYFQWLDRAAAHGSWMAMMNLTAAYREGKGAYDGHGPEIDPEQCFAWSLQAEKAVRAYWDHYAQPTYTDFGDLFSRLLVGYLRACAQLSSLYADGFGVNRDLKRALYWLERGKRFGINATGDRGFAEMDQLIADVRARMEREKLRKNTQNKQDSE